MYNKHMILYTVHNKGFIVRALHYTYTTFTWMQDDVFA